MSLFDIGQLVSQTSLELFHGVLSPVEHTLVRVAIATDHYVEELHGLCSAMSLLMLSFRSMADIQLSKSAYMMCGERAIACPFDGSDRIQPAVLPPRSAYAYGWNLALQNATIRHPHWKSAIPEKSSSP